MPVLGNEKAVYVGFPIHLEGFSSVRVFEPESETGLGYELGAQEWKGTNGSWTGAP